MIIIVARGIITRAFKSNMARHLCAVCSLLFGHCKYMLRMRNKELFGATCGVFDFFSFPFF